VFVPTQNPRQNPRRSPYVQRYQTKAEHGASTEHASPPLVPLARKVPAKFCRIILHFHRASAPLAFHSPQYSAPKNIQIHNGTDVLLPNVLRFAHPLLYPIGYEHPVDFCWVGTPPDRALAVLPPVAQTIAQKLRLSIGFKGKTARRGLQFDPTPSMSVYPRRPRRRTW
jgi:hypothetical protein